MSNLVIITLYSKNRTLKNEVLKKSTLKKSIEKQFIAFLKVTVD